MYLKHCKLSRSEQLELMKYFVAGSTARTAADLVGIHRNTAIRFFHKLREKIALSSSKIEASNFVGKSNSMKVILVEHAKENGVEVPLERWPFLVF